MTYTASIESHGDIPSEVASVVFKAAYEDFLRNHYGTASWYDVGKEFSMTIREADARHKI